jgi:putative PIN family toxin of toxin-antitoxin system
MFRWTRAKRTQKQVSFEDEERNRVRCTYLLVRLVLDTSVMVSAFRSRNGASRRIFNLVLERRIRLVATAALYFEYETVLKRSSQSAVHGYTPFEIDRFLVLLAGFTDKTDVFYRWRPQLSDPDDEMVLDAAISGQAQAIVTHNTRDFLPAALRFGIQVATPAIMLKWRLKDE